MRLYCESKKTIKISNSCPSGAVLVSDGHCFMSIDVVSYKTKVGVIKDKEESKMKALLVKFK